MEFSELQSRIEAILMGQPGTAPRVIGASREGRPIEAFRFGTGPLRVSLIGGCHADEPVGPRMLRHLTGYLGTLGGDDELLRDFSWWIVPHINPDGELKNQKWYSDSDARYDLRRYLKHVERELPGDDIEFGFPEDTADVKARPENRALYDWWCTAGGEFAIHVSFHGMGFAAGPWFLIEEAWRSRIDLLQERCTTSVARLGYELHDVERHGEKGFFRIGRGFCTRPDSRNMRKHFLGLGDTETAARFRPSSMETIRSLGGDPLTLVSEMPLFITPGIGVDLGPPDPVAVRWKKTIADWRLRARSEKRDPDLADEIDRSAVRPMPVRDQMRLQLAFLGAGLEAITGGTS